jgi:SAM-dependent methyltransferase
MDQPISYTLEFVRRHLPIGCRRILEVGSGDGHLSGGLLNLGYDMIAIEADADAAAAAQRLGITVYQTTWPNAEVTGFDAILFTRSLHHIHPLPEAIDRAWEALNAGGKILIEDFRYKEVGQRTIEWFAAVVKILMAVGALDESVTWLGQIAASQRRVDVWMANHEHDLSSIREIEEAVIKRFGRVEKENAAYFFRYIREAVRENDRRERICEAVLQMEELLVAFGAIEALGQRIVAQRPA